MMTSACDRRGFLLGATATACVGCESLRSIAGGTNGVIRIAHCGDPQLGFGPGGEKAYANDLARFEKVIEAVNALHPDLCYIAGDMVNVASELERDWPRLVRRFTVPVVVTPGNHDMGNTLTKENVERFERVFGYEYTSVKVGSWRFISGNSQYWRPTAETARRDRYEKWLAAELAGAKTRGEPIILATHISPVMWSLDEADGYENYPKEGRAERLDLYLKSGVKFYLSGHTHRMFARGMRGITLLNSETTCRNFDGLPFGFRLFTLHEDGTYTWNFNRILI